MSRELFAATVVARPKPARARWMVVVSVLVHTGVLVVVLIGPILSATQGIVALARGVVYVVPVARPMPQSPASPPSRSAAPSVNPNAAPPQAPKDPVTTEPTVSSGPPGPPAFRTGDPSGTPGAPPNAPLVKFTPPDPPPVPRKVDPVRIGGQIRAPHRIVYVAPEYPMVALKARIEESVTLEATIDEQGNVRNVRAVRPSPLFEKAAIDAVSKWRYEPTRLNGQAVPVILTVTVSFEIKK